jgi:hypothetical protein
VAISRIGAVKFAATATRTSPAETGPDKTQKISPAKKDFFICSLGFPAERYRKFN